MGFSDPTTQVKPIVAMVMQPAPVSVGGPFYDMSSEKQIRIPTQNEKRGRDFLASIKKNKRPVALFVDEAHDLNGYRYEMMLVILALGCVPQLHASAAGEGHSIALPLY
ncbi:Uncharacterised protein [Serratia fonticola]|nr:Uncharacterised protein [Serratia fonticola]